MDKNQFINVLHHFSESSVEEAQEILSLKADYPYSQMLHALSARVSKDHGFSTQQQELQLAAVYASDRGVLKDIMNKSFSDFSARVYSPTLPPPAKKANAENAELVEVAATVVAAPEIPQAEDVADQIILDLDRLHELKHNFEMMFVDLQEGREPQPIAKKAAEPKKEIVVEEAPKKESSKARKARIVELARSLSSTESSPVTHDSKPARKKNQPVDALIEEIKITKKELKPSGEKQKEQQQIIDKFIKTAPSIANTKEKIATAPAGDLSSIKSGEFSDNIVSETLVDILIQQGKKDKAIEVLKKLIWKFPQKKTYFAAQIEELKK